MRRDLLDRLRRARAARQPAVLLTWLADGAQRLWSGSDDETELPAALRDAVRRALHEGSSTLVELEPGAVFVHAQLPAPRMLIVGAVHIAQVLAPIAVLAGFEVRVIDPRRGFASERRFAGVTLDRRWPEEALRALAPDSRTAVVTLTHDAKLDDPALRVALRSDAFYIAALGSRRTHTARLERLRETGIDAPALARLHGPAGLDIGAVGAAEIAVSILAQAIAVLREMRRDRQARAPGGQG